MDWNLITMIDDQQNKTSCPLTNILRNNNAFVCCLDKHFTRMLPKNVVYVDSSLGFETQPQAQTGSL